MQFKELQTKLEKLTNSKVSLTEIGNALGIKLSTVSTRAKNNSSLKYAEIKKIENYFNVSIYDEASTETAPVTYKNEKIQNMINSLNIGIAAYGLYWAIVEIIFEKGIKTGCEKLIAEELNAAEKYVYSILNDFGLFYIKNNFYCSIFSEHAVLSSSPYAELFNCIKNEIFTDVLHRLQSENTLQLYTNRA